MGVHSVSEGTLNIVPGLNSRPDFFKELEIKTGLKVYFADPYAAWQRGTNENTNDLLRQYFPKGTDFRKVTKEDLALELKKLSHKPRKCLGYWSPHEVFWQASSGALTT